MWFGKRERQPKVIGIKITSGPPSAPIWALECSTCKRVRGWTLAKERPGECACICCGEPTVATPSYCPSTHGATGPFERICSFCGAEITRETVYEEEE